MIRVVTFDIWDTILKRKCHPEEIKLSTCQYIYFKYKNYIKDDYKNIYDILKLRNKIERDLCIINQEKGLDRECNILEVFDLLNECLLNKSVDNFREELLQFEISHEIEMAYVNPEFFELVKKYENCELYCISDFYMPSEYLQDIFKAKGILKYFKKIYSSADYLLTKKSGNLFRKFQNDLKVSLADILHIGDNQVSDIEVPVSMGINTYKITDVNKYIKIGDRKFDYEKVLGLKKKSSLYEIGKDLSIIPYYFVLKILTEEFAKGNKMVYYFTREGEIFSKVHQIINSNNFYGTNSCQSSILEVSRMATFAPSLKGFSIDELMNLWRQYKKQSIRSLYLTLNINLEKYLQYFEKYSINVDEIIHEPWKDKKIKKLFADKNFVLSMNEEIDYKKGELLKYFANKNISDNQDNLAVVDIGWRGTIQDNLARIFRKKRIDGYYLAIFDYFNEQPKNVKKTSIIKEKEFIDKYVGGLITFFEMIFIPNSGSVIDYCDSKANRKILEDEYKMISEYITEIQQGMFDGIKILDEYFAIHPYDILELYEIFKQKIISVRKHPSKLLVDVYFKLVLNDTFGSGKYVKKNRKLKFYEKFNLKKCLDLMRKESWKEAFLVYNRLHVLSLAFCFKDKLDSKR